MGPGGRFSGLTTRGRCLLAGGGATSVCAVILDERDLLRVGVFVAVLPLLALLLASRTRRTVRAERTVEPPRVPIGAPVDVELQLTGGPLLGALRLVDAAPDAAGPQADAPPRFTVHRLSSRGTATLTYPLQPVLRGVHRVGPLTGTATDPLWTATPIALQSFASFGRFASASAGTQAVPTDLSTDGSSFTVTYSELDAPSRRLLEQAMSRLALSARAYDRVLKVARTIADLAGSESIESPHLAEAIHYRALDKAYFRPNT